jgi:hypothetical protein
MEDADVITLHGTHGVNVVESIFLESLFDWAISDLPALEDMDFDLVSLVPSKSWHFLSI